jgi:hypothetical protein
MTGRVEMLAFNPPYSKIEMMVLDAHQRKANMSRVLGGVLVLASCLFVAGCGSTSDEVPPLTQPGTDPSPEQQRNWMEESRRHGTGGSAPPAETPAGDAQTTN